MFIINYYNNYYLKDNIKMMQGVGLLPVQVIILTDVDIYIPAIK